jgi:predicted N-formylglutamate amidohydrolase
VCAVPEWHRDRFRDSEEVLTSHRGWDPGALNLAQAFAMKTRTPLAHGEVTRLLIDLNRSPDNPARFSEFAAGLTDEQRQKLHDRYFTSYLDILTERIGSGLKISPPVVHLSIHTFVREHEGSRRSTDIGILFDPARPAEAAFATRWLTNLRAAAPDLRFDANAPYAGTDDGITVLFRQRYPDPDYLGIELEVCQSFFLDGHPWRWDRTKKLLLDTLQFDQVPGTRS